MAPQFWWHAVIIPDAAILLLASKCAPNVAPSTVMAIVRAESNGDPWALNVNGARGLTHQAHRANATATARRFVAAGYSVDLGIGQINSRHMRKLGLSWKTIFEPCANIAALGQILTRDYEAVSSGRPPQTALRLAISLYNTGSISRGFRNGYVARVVRNARIAAVITTAGPDTGSVPTNDGESPRRTAADQAVSLGRSPDRALSPPTWEIFAHVVDERNLGNPRRQQGLTTWTN